MTFPKIIEIEEYNSEWLSIFEYEAELIRKHLEEKVVDIHHIGSTAVPSLAAKPQIDVLLVTDNLENILKLQNIGYIFKGEVNIPFRHFYSKNTEYSKVNLHVTPPWLNFIKLQLCFKNYLRENQKVRNDYAVLKRELVGEPKSHERLSNNFPYYTLKKNQFIKEVLKKAGFNEYVVNFCLHESEWEIYHKIREKELFAPIKITYDRNHLSITNSKCFHFVLYKGTIIVAAAMIEFISDKVAVLRSLATCREYQNKGCGTYLLKFLEKWIVLRNKNIIKLHANLRAEDFYRKLGYKDIEFDDVPLTNETVKLGKFVCN